MEQESEEEQFARLKDTWEKLGQGERNILMVFIYRLYTGQKRHGKITRTKKDWTYEALEEAIDGAVYLSAALEAKCGLAEEAAIRAAEEEASRPQNWVVENMAVITGTEAIDGQTTWEQEQDGYAEQLPDTEREPSCGAV